MRLTDLPDWKKLIKLLGEDNAGVLSAMYGGGRMYVPKLLGPHHPITESIGKAAAAALVAEFGGGHVEIPMALGKRAQVVQLLEAGQPVPAICRRVGVSRRHVFYVKAELRDGESEPPQPDLFSKAS